jgi:hypothetical protein
MNRAIAMTLSLLVFVAIGCASVAADDPSMSQAVFYVR